MLAYTQLTWADRDDPAGTLAAFYDFKTLKGFEIIRTEPVSDIMTDVTLVVKYEAITNQVDTKEITARVIKEIAPFDPSPQGQWGVNPISTLRETDVN